jgi:hypothetical protein
LKGRYYHTWVIGETAHFLDALKMAWIARLISSTSPNANQPVIRDSDGENFERTMTEDEFIERVLQSLGIG